MNIAPRLRTQVADTLRTAIIVGELRPGERLVERILCERIGVSRTSLREALRELENEGLVTNLPNRGLIVSLLDHKTVRDVFDVREMLEALISRRFCENANDAQIEEGKASYREVEIAYGEGIPRNMLSAKNRFYDVLMVGADNKDAERMLRSIHIRVSQVRTISLSDVGRRTRSLVELSDLMESLVRRDAQEAERLSRVHVRRAAEFALGQIGPVEAQAED
ncbi:MAG: GntR family transcriptional regulator [Mesorhizobium sp.]|nr:GntR family transcriptional regulator [Mesorhizobium sp.]